MSDPLQHLPPSGAHADIELWMRAKALFDELIAMPAHARNSRIAARCGDDAALCRSVESLLKSHEALSETSEDPLALEIRGALSRIWPSVEPGQRFGAFAIVREIGHGGMGAVYLAERDDGTVSQRVALKIIGRIGLDAEAVRRLGRERQLLANLEHPNIARLIDAGADSSGVPYFAMEYVDGQPITRYCDEHGLTIDARLSLFRDVCAAVQYAHAHLIVHSDLKPGNILVTASGLVKLLDFGIASSIAAVPASINDMQSPDAERRFLSPHAAAPEQFLGQPGSVAADVYALGVLLCELMGGRRPFEFADQPTREIERRVLHVAPLLPAGAVDEQAAQQRGGKSLATLRRQLRGDIDAIVDKSLRKLPQQRYTSVDLLDADIARHRSHYPIDARRHESGYRLLKLLRRHVLAVGFAGVLLVLLVAFALITLAQNRQLAEERDEAQRRERQALFEQARARQVTDFVVGLFRYADPAQARGRDLSARDLLARGHRQLETELRQQPELRASMLAVISDIDLALDNLDDAQRTADEASQLREGLAPEHPSERASSLRQLAQLANRRGHYADALALVDRALGLDDPLNTQERGETLAAKAAALAGLARTKESVASWREALDLQSRAYGEDDVRTLRTAMDYAFALRTAGLFNEAEQVLNQQLSRERRLFEPNDPRLGETLLDLAIMARNKKNLDQAEPFAREALEIYSRVYSENSTQIASAANTLATIAQARGDYATARRLFERALAIKQSVYGRESVQVASAEYNVGLLLLLRLKDPTTALKHLTAANEIGARLLTPTHTNLANYRLALGSALRELHHHAEAEIVLRQALASFQVTNAPRGIDIALARGELACVNLARIGSAEVEASAKAERQSALAVLDRNAHDDPQVQRLRSCLGDR